MPVNVPRKKSDIFDMRCSTTIDVTNGNIQISHMITFFFFIGVDRLLSLMMLTCRSVWQTAF